MGRYRWFWPLAVACACRSHDVPARALVFDFEADEAPWEVTSGNLSAEPSHRRSAIRRHGRGFLDTAEADDTHDLARHGVLTSPVFAIDHPYLVFRAGSLGDVAQCWVELRDVQTGKRVRKVEAVGVWPMQTHVVDVASMHGRDVRLRLVDQGKGEPCSIHLDWVRLVDG